MSELQGLKKAIDSQTVSDSGGTTEQNISKTDTELEEVNLDIPQTEAIVDRIKTLLKQEKQDKKADKKK